MGRVTRSRREREKRTRSENPTRHIATLFKFAIANLTQNIDNEPALRQARCQEGGGLDRDLAQRPLVEVYALYGGQRQDAPDDFEAPDGA